MHNYILSSATRYVSKIILTLALMLAATQTIYADSMKLGYCEGNAVSFYPAAKESPAGGSAVFFPEALMQAYSGTDIVSFHIWSSIMEPSTVHFAIRKAALTEARHFMNRQPPLKNTDGTRCALKSRSG